MTAFAVVELGLSDEAFRRLTFARFNALAQMQRHRERRSDARFGLLATLLYNANRGKDAPIRRPEDFFPSLLEMTQKRRRQSPKRLVTMFRALAQRQKLIEGAV